MNNNWPIYSIQFLDN